MQMRIEKKSIRISLANSSVMLRVCALILLVLVSVGNVHALPFNDDMFHDQYKTGEVMRPNPKGSVPVGVKDRWVESKEEAETLKNPVEPTSASELRGERLWETNCTPCHGSFQGSGFERVIPLSTGLPLGPDVSIDAYRERTDGFFFGTIHFGGVALMPRYGYKLSINEHWDIVNYIRKTQRERSENDAAKE